jgi:hypothetical protein
VEQSKLLKVLKLEYTSDIRVVYKAAKRYARDVHPDQNPDKKHLWLEFEIAYNVIKRLSDTGLSFDNYSEALDNTPGGKKTSSRQPGKTSNKAKQNEDSQKSQQKRSQSTSEKPKPGADISIRIKARFDQIVYGCTLDVKIPAPSANKDPSIQRVTIEVTPTPIWTNKDGSISQKSLNAVFNKKVLVYGYGEKGSDGGSSGDLIVSFDIDTSESQAIREVISVHFGMKNQFTDYSRSRADYEANSEPQKEEPVQYRNPKKSSKKDRIAKLIGVIVLASWLVNYISGNVDKNNSMDATFAICSSAESINADILWSKFYNYENPYTAAIYFKYFSKDIDTIDNISTIESELLRIKDDDYLGIRSYAQELINAIEQNDVSVVRAMNKLKAECGARDSFWSD